MVVQIFLIQDFIYKEKLRNWLYLKILSVNNQRRVIGKIKNQISEIKKIPFYQKFKIIIELCRYYIEKYCKDKKTGSIKESEDLIP